MKKIKNPCNNTWKSCKHLKCVDELASVLELIPVYSERLVPIINIMNLSCENIKLYDSTFLSFSYAKKKNEEFKNLDTFTKLSPPREELDKCDSRFYNKINKGLII